MKKRILSILLLLAMVVTLAACGPDDGGKDDGKDPVDSSNTIAGIEKKNYDKEFTILYPDSGLYPLYFFTEENDGEAMSVALYNREMKIEEHLGLDINFVYPDVNGDHDINAVYPALQQMAMSGDDMYQIVLNHCITGTAVMITEGMLLDLNTVDSINFENEWWNHVSNDNLQVAGKQFFAINDFMLPDPELVLFNKTMIDEHGLESPYQLVRDGEWTLDKMMEMMSYITADDGNGFWNVYDTYGFGAASDHMLTPFTYASGLLLVNKDENGEFKFAYDSRKVYDVAEKLAQLLKSSDTHVYYWGHDTGYAPGGANAAMSLNIGTGRCLFALSGVSLLHNYRDSIVDFGILPYPKYDENQEDYITIDWSGLMCAPLTTKDHEMVGEVMELYGCLSEAEVLPAYYDIVLGEKLSRDEASKEMLDYIFDGIIFDAGMNYFGFDTNMTRFWNLGSAISERTWSGYASFLETYMEGAKTEIENFNFAVSMLDEE